MGKTNSYKNNIPFKRFIDGEKFNNKGIHKNNEQTILNDFFNKITAFDIKNEAKGTFKQIRNAIQDENFSKLEIKKHENFYEFKVYCKNDIKSEFMIFNHSLDKDARYKLDDLMNKSIFLHKIDCKDLNKIPLTSGKQYIRKVENCISNHLKLTGFEREKKTSINK